MSFEPTDGEETVDESCGGPWRLLELWPEKGARRRERRDEAARLFEKLRLAAPEQQLELISKARFRSLDLLDLLLERSHESQPADPPRAEHLADLAARLAARLASADPEAAVALPHAFCLAANARRLRGDPDGADARLARAVPWLHFPSERAIYSRTAALVRWEQGRADEAAALLEYAIDLFGSEGLAGEEGACQALLGLLRMEEREIGDPFPRLVAGWAAMDRERRPRIALRTCLSLAACQAERGQPDRAWRVLPEAVPLMVHLRDEREAMRSLAAQGRVIGHLGEREEGLRMLEGIRLKLFEEPSPAEAALVSLDLALLLAEASRAPEIDTLAADLAAGFPDEPAMTLALGTLANFADLAMSGEPRLREAADDAARTMRRTFRACRLAIQPMPFA